MIPARELIGSHDVLLVTLDTLRYDVARDALLAGRTPNLARVLPGGRWEAAPLAGQLHVRRAPGVFRRLPADARPARASTRGCSRRAFPAARRRATHTCVFDAPDIVTGLAACGYHTICIGGVGFFNKQEPAGLRAARPVRREPLERSPGRHQPHSTERQVELACDRLQDVAPGQRVFLFLNVSALHQPNCIFAPPGDGGLARDASRRAGLRRSPLAAAVRRPCRPRAPVLCIICSRPRHGLRRGRLPRPPPRPSGRCGPCPMPSSCCPAHPGSPMTAAVAEDLDRVLNGSPFVAYTYAYPHKTAYRPLPTRLPLRRRLARRAPRRAVPLPARAVLRDALRLLQPVHALAAGGRCRGAIWPPCGARRPPAAHSATPHSRAWRSAAARRRFSRWMSWLSCST